MIKMSVSKSLTSGFSLSVGCTLILMTLSACQDKPRKNIETLDTDARTLALMQCKARHLQQERVQLAQQLMSVQDAQLLYKDNPSKINELQFALDSIHFKADILQSQTKQMADSIRHFINGLWKTTYQDTSDRRVLDRATEIFFEKECPHL